MISGQRRYGSLPETQGKLPFDGRFSMLMLAVLLDLFDGSEKKVMVDINGASLITGRSSRQPLILAP
jgi:hypothetical protein